MLQKFHSTVHVLRKWNSCEVLVTSRLLRLLSTHSSTISVRRDYFIVTVNVVNSELYHMIGMFH